MRTPEGKRARDDGDRQDAHAGGDFGDDGRGPGSGPATQAGGDKDHVGALQAGRDLVGVLFGRLGANPRIAARAEPAGRLFADADPLGRQRAHQGLGVGVDGYEVQAVELLADHPVDRVAAAAADSDDLQDGRVRSVYTIARRPGAAARNAGDDIATTSRFSHARALEKSRFQIDASTMPNAWFYIPHILPAAAKRGPPDSYLDQEMLG